jgi:nicotinate phosphoribosyltransferase
MTMTTNPTPRIPFGPIRDYEKLPRIRGYGSFVNTLGPLLCDRYALTMTYAAWKLGFVEERQTTSNVFCRSLLNNGETFKDSGGDETRNVKIPYLINAGLGLVGEWYDGWHWKDRDLRHLALQRVDDGKGNTIRLFPNEFLHWLSRQKLALDIKAIPEGQLIFPQEPSLQISGPWWQQMAVEATTLGLISSSTNLATVATQVRFAATREAYAASMPLVEASAKSFASLAEMALRRSPSIGALQSARAAAIAGWDTTSNDYAGMCYGIPVMGTFAHAWVMLHDTEEEAFDNWAKAFPGSTVFLADTYSTVEGVKTAIRICQKHGLKLKGIRLDSGNLGWLSREVHALLAEAGYPDAIILATDSISVGAAASLYGRVATEVTNLESYVTGFGIGSEVAVNRNNPLLDFVMKLAARHPDRSSHDELVRELIKLSETEKKTTLPGLIDVVRYIDKNGRWAGDTIIPTDLDIGEGTLSRDLYSENIATGKVKPFPKGAPFVRLLEPWMRKGKMIVPAYRERNAPSILAASRETCAGTLAHLDPEHLKLPPGLPHEYGVGLAEELATKRRAAVGRIRAQQELEKQRDRFVLKAA